MWETHLGLARGKPYLVSIIFERCRDVNYDIYAYFINYHKAFDRAQHHKMTEVLISNGLNDKELTIIINLYCISFQF